MIEPMNHFCTGEDLFGLILGNLAFFHAVFIILQILFFYSFAPLQQTASLIQKDKRRKRSHIIKKAHTLAVLFLRVQLRRRIEG